MGTHEISEYQVSRDTWDVPKQSPGHGAPMNPRILSIPGILGDVPGAHASQYKYTLLGNTIWVDIIIDNV